MRRMRAATYRVQLHAGFTFDDAAAVVDYLADLGVSHLYCSPYLQAAKGSTHGYDVIDHGRLNDELGGAAGHSRLVSRLAGAGLGQVLDIVPNHMALAGRANAWWWDVLENGPSSRYARYFDIDWDPPQAKLADTVLMPVLGDHYGRVLEAGELVIERHAGSFTVRYYDHEAPLSPRTLDGLLSRAAARAGSRELEHLAAAYGRLPLASLTDPADVEERHRGKEELRARLGELSGAEPEVAAALDAEIEDLKRDPDALDALPDPEGYLCRLHGATGGAYVVVEKILAADEELPRSWPVAGTTGYDFLNHVNRLFVDSGHETAMRDCYARFTGEHADYAEVVHAAKVQIMREELAAEVERLTGVLADVCERHRRQRDQTRRDLRDTLREVIAAFPVYRTYARPGRPVTSADRAYVAAAVAAVRQHRPDLDGELVGFIGELLVLDHPGDVEADFALRFAQVSAPVMAKGVEDTAFYRYQPLASLNEVGGDPGRFGAPVEEFHQAMTEAARRWPEAMLTLSTHDTKRSGDVRARIALLSELPEAWEHAAERWAHRNKRFKQNGWPDRNAEYLLYQTLVGAWPIDAGRVSAFIEKAAKEAKVHTSWTDPHADYDAALGAFATAILADPGFVADLEAFLARYRLVERGRVNSLAQTTLLLTCPGIPDLYQGTEVWDLSLVDPDNRRPVDYDARRRLFAAVAGAGPERALDRDDEGGPKLWLIHRLLGHRRRHPAAYGPGSGHEPLPVLGPASSHAVAFTRTGGLAVVVPRLVTGLADDWSGTTVALPGGAWVSVLDGEAVPGGETSLAALLGRFPVAILGRAGDYLSEPEGRGVAWTKERGTSDEGRRRLQAPRRRAGNTA